MNPFRFNSLLQCQINLGVKLIELVLVVTSLLFFIYISKQIKTINKKLQMMECFRNAKTYF